MSAHLNDAVRIRLKSDPDALLDVLSLTRIGAHLPCCLCGSSDAMSIKQFNDGTYFFKCFSCGKCGDYFRAYALVFNISDGEAIRRNADSNQEKVSARRQSLQKKKAAPPRNLEAETALARRWAFDLEHDPELQDFLWRTRAITADTASRWGVGVKDVRRRVGTQPASCTWTMPIISPEPPRRLVGVKIHRQFPLPGTKKGGWLVGGGTALFPLPEAFGLRPGASIILAPGELKALTFVSAGLPASAPTTGESMNLKSWQKLAPRFAGLSVKIDPDREDSKAAKDFEINASAALLATAASVEVLQ